MTDEQEEETRISPDELIAICEFIEKDIEKMSDKMLPTPPDGIPVQFADGMVEVFRAGHEGLPEIKRQLKSEGIDADAVIAHIRQRFQNRSSTVARFPSPAWKGRGPFPA